MPHSLDQWHAKEVLAFCQEHGLSEKLQLAVERVTQAFPDAQRMTVAVEQDAESGHRWILIDVIVAGPVNEIHLRHQKCDDELGRLLRWPASALIHTTYTLACDP